MKQHEKMIDIRITYTREELAAILRSFEEEASEGNILDLADLIVENLELDWDFIKECYQDIGVSLEADDEVDE